MQVINRVFISGPMTGLPNFNYDQFNRIGEVLASGDRLGGGKIPSVINPARNFAGSQTRHRSEYLKMALLQIVACDALVLLPGWADSRGAQLEAHAGVELGKRFFQARTNGSRWQFEEITGQVCDAVTKLYGFEPMFVSLPDEVTPEELAESVRFATTWGPYFEASRLIRPEFQDVPLVEEWIEREASRIVRDGPRQQQYGHPRKDFTRVAAMWTAMLGTEVTAEQVAIMMIAFKLARLSQSPQHRDTKVDIIGYTVTLDLLGGGSSMTDEMPREYLIDAIEALMIQRIILRRALEDAIEGMEEMIGYVPDYFREKWEHDSYIARAKKALEVSAWATPDLLPGEEPA